MEKLNIKKMLNKVVVDYRDKVINALNLSDVTVDSGITDRELNTLVMMELKKENNKLIYNLGYVFDDIFDLSVFTTQDLNSRAVSLEEMALEENQLQGINNLDADYSNASGMFTVANPDEMAEMNTATFNTKPSNSWWQSNKGNIGSTLTAGVGMLGNIFGGIKDTSTPVSAPNDGSSGMFTMMQNQQNIAAQNARDDARRREDESSQSRTNMMIFGGIGGVVVLGLVVFLVVKKS